MFVDICIIFILLPVVCMPDYQKLRVFFFSFKALCWRELLSEGGSYASRQITVGDTEADLVGS